jgi:ABC-2 type transport system ATP-binding protein
MVSKRMIQAFQLSKAFNEKRVVNNLTFTIKEGEIFGFLGPNGAGKTTTIRMLAAIFPPTEGTAKVAGLDIITDAMKIRSMIGLLSENPSLYERLTAKENLHYFARLYDVPEDQINNRISFLSDLFDLRMRMDDKVGTFSKGMKQKLAIAKALIHDPAILFLDEPTSSLSPVAAKSIRDLLVNLAKDRSRTVCICTHNLFDAERLCDRVAIIEHGKIITIGTPAEISQQYSGHPTIRIVLQNDVKKIQETLLQQEGVLSIEKHPILDELKIKIANHQKITPRVVEKIISLGGKVLEIEPIYASLEEAYLTLLAKERVKE